MYVACPARTPEQNKISNISSLSPFSYLRQGCPGPRALCCHGEHCGDTKAHSSWGCIHVDPEGDPGQDDDEQAGDVHLDQVVAHLSLQVELNFDAGEFTCHHNR